MVKTITIKKTKNISSKGFITQSNKVNATSSLGHTALLFGIKLIILKFMQSFH